MSDRQKGEHTQNTSALETGKRNLKVLKGLCAFLPADRGLKRNGGKGRSRDRVVAIVGTR